MVRTPPFQGENPGSNPSGAATMSSRAIYRDASGMPRRAVPERNCYDPFGGRFILCQSPDENRRFDTIVGKNKRNTLRAVRALRVVSNANNPSGAATMSSRAIYRDASGMPRRAVPERNRQMTHLGHFHFNNHFYPCIYLCGI